MADKVVCVRNVILPLAYPRLHSHRGMLKTQRQRQLHRPHLNIQSTSNNYGGKNTATRKHLVLSQPAQWHMVVVPPSKYQLSLLLWHWPPCADIIFLPFGFFYLSFFPRLFSVVADWMYTIHGVASVQIYDAGLKCAAHNSLKMQDANNCQKFAIWAPSHNYVGLYLRN